MSLEKQVSLDGINFAAAGDSKAALVIPEKKTTRVFYKVTLKNESNATINDLSLRHNFITGKTDMTAGSLEDVRGATVKQNGSTEILTVGKIMPNETATFFYAVPVQETGKNANYAQDILEVNRFSTNVPVPQASLKINLVGTQATFLIAGMNPNAEEAPAAETVTAETPQPTESASPAPAPVTPAAPAAGRVQLAQTGPAGILFLLLLAMATAGLLPRLRYSLLKRRALQPL